MSANKSSTKATSMITREVCIRCGRVCLFYWTFFASSLLIAQHLPGQTSTLPWSKRCRERGRGQGTSHADPEAHTGAGCGTKRAGAAERRKLNAASKLCKYKWNRSDGHQSVRGPRPGSESKKLPESAKPQQPMIYNGRPRIRIPETSSVPAQMQRWQRVRDLAKQQFLGYPEQSRGAVKSGPRL